MVLNDIIVMLSTKIPLTNITVGDILLMVLVIFIGYFISIIVSKYVRRAILKAKMTEILAEFTSRVIRILLIIFFIAIGIGFLGIDVGAALISISVVSGFILGFAFQDTLGNLAAGFMIAITRPFNVGDYVDMAEESGSIKSVGSSITTLITVDNKRIIIPNSKIWGKLPQEFKDNLM